MKVRDGSGEAVTFQNGVTVSLEKKRPEGMPVAGEMLLSNTFRKEMGKCSDIPFYKSVRRLVPPVGFVLTDTGCCFSVYRGDISAVPVSAVLGVVVLAVCVQVLAMKPASVLPVTGTSSGSSSTASLIAGDVQSLPDGTDISGNHASDVQTGALSPTGKKPVEFEEVKPDGSSSSKNSDETTVAASKQLPFQWNLTPTLKEGKLHIRFAPTGSEAVKCFITVQVDETQIYESGPITSGHFIEYATVDKTLPAGNYKGTCTVSWLTDSNAVYSTVVLPLDKVTVKE